MKVLLVNEAEYELNEGKMTKMPFEMFKQKTLELIASYENPQNDILPSCDTLIEDLSTFFIVSRVSVKYRLIEVGLLDRLRDFNDFDAVFVSLITK